MDKRLLASKLGLTDEDDKIISKAEEFQRLLEIKSSAFNITDTAKAVICLDLAASCFTKDVDLKTAIKCSGLKGPSYVNSKKIVENILELNKETLSIGSLCLLLQCSVQDLAETILQEYKKYSKIELGMDLPQYVCMAVFQACRISKIKVSKSKLMDKSRLKPAQWSKLDADWTKFVDEKFSTVIKQKKGRPAKNAAVIEDEDKMAVDPVNIKTEEQTEPLIEPYEEWKRRVLEAACKELENLKEILNSNKKQVPTPNKLKLSPNKHNTTPNKQEFSANKQKLSPNKLKDSPNELKDQARVAVESGVKKLNFDSPRKSPRKTPQKHEPYQITKPKAFKLVFK